MRKKPSWRAKAVNIIFALALAIGLMPILAAPVLAGVVVPDFTATSVDWPTVKVGDEVTFTGTATDDGVPFTPDAYTFDFGDGDTWTQANGPWPTATHTYTAMGVYTVSLVITEGEIVQTEVKENYITVEEGLHPQIAWNALWTEEEFCVPLPGYEGHVTEWRYMNTLGLGAGEWVVTSGGDPGDNCVTVRASDVGELHIYADTDVDLDEDGANDTLHGVKKWAKIDLTEIYWDDPENGRVLMTSMACPDGCGPSVQYGSGSTQIVWDENIKEFVGEATIIDVVSGYFNIDPATMLHTADGAEVWFWIMAENAPVMSLSCGTYFGNSLGMGGSGLQAEIDAMQAAYPATQVTFVGDDQKTMVVSGPDGEAEVTLTAAGEEAIKVVVVATYPVDNQEEPEWLVCPEFLSWNFWTENLEKVPQVRWAGEKIVLEKQFGGNHAGKPVVFSLENQAVGALEAITPPIEGYEQSSDTIWTTCDGDGVARCIAVCEDEGELDVDLALYEWSGEEVGMLNNQHGFVVFFLKFEDITLGNVEGNRTDNPLTSAVEGHDSGIWDPENPWTGADDVAGDGSGEDLLTGLVTPVDPTDGVYNVSQDAMLRARVRGWFTGDNDSNRPARVIDSNNNGVYDIRDTVLPAGRWVLPNDWPALAGHDPNSGDTQWMQLRPHWDIMDQPNDDIMSTTDGMRSWNGITQTWNLTQQADKAEELGSYWQWIESPVSGESAPVALVANAPVIGPYNSLDNYTVDVNPLLARKTIVRNAKLNWWDAPMPPAEVIFEILAEVTDGDPAVPDGAGYFKEVDKGDVYYHLENLTDVVSDPGGGPNTILYTNPFYEELIPASDEIPAFINDGGYRWDSSQVSYGTYPFWDFASRQPGMTPSTEQKPTKVIVYSDNHGEAMVYLNGDWNLDLEEYWTGSEPAHTYEEWSRTAGYDVPTDETIGETIVVVKGMYPYLEKHQPVYGYGDAAAPDRAEVTKEWTWGWEKVFMIQQLAVVNNGQDNGHKAVWVFLCDRDGMPAVDTEILWTYDGSGLGIYNWLDGTSGTPETPTKTGTSYTRMPDVSEAGKFELVTGRVCHHAVAGVEVVNNYDDGSPEQALAQLYITMYMRVGRITHAQPINFAVPSSSDPYLYVGLNLIEFNFVDQPIVPGMAGVAEHIVAVWTYEGGEWLLYTPRSPESSNLTMLRNGATYYITVDQNCNWMPPL